eukprot:5735419-Pleurochrysis_carterae.AAC.1
MKRSGSYWRANTAALASPRRVAPERAFTDQLPPPASRNAPRRVPRASVPRLRHGLVDSGGVVACIVASNHASTACGRFLRCSLRGPAVPGPAMLSGASVLTPFSASAADPAPRSISHARNGSHNGVM